MINLIFILVSAILIELLTIFGRFFFKLNSKDTYIRIIKKYNIKFMIHIHHLFIGLIIFVFSYYFKSSIFLNLGLGIALSDIIHHFLVLWPITGNPEFHIVYKNPKHFKDEQKLENKKIKKFLSYIIHRFK